MSRQLAISSALSVLAMSAFVLFGPHTAPDPMVAQAHTGPVRAAALAPPQPSARVHLAR